MFLFCILNCGKTHNKIRLLILATLSVPRPQRRRDLQKTETQYVNKVKNTFSVAKIATEGKNDKLSNSVLPDTD